jgi:cell shape-determining protein MreC
MVDVDVSITNQDFQEVVRENPTVALQLQIKALTRKCNELAEEIATLKAELGESLGSKSIEEEGD